MQGSATTCELGPRHLDASPYGRWTMKQSTCYRIFLQLGATLLISTAFGAAPTGELTPAIMHVLTEGKSNDIPPAFSRALGLTTNQPASGKVIISKRDSETNSFWVSLQDSNTAVIITRKANLSWYYLTDASGPLRRAFRQPCQPTSRLGNESAVGTRLGRHVL